MDYEKRRTTTNKRVPAPRVSGQASRLRGGGALSNKQLSGYVAEKSAFTLAEVLITLGIIGIVAAITIPGLIAKHRKHVVEARLKKTYSVLFNAIRRSETENGKLLYPVNDLCNQVICTHTSEIFDTYIFPYLTVVASEKPHTSTDSRAIFLPDETKIVFAVNRYNWPYNNQSPSRVGIFDVMFEKDKNKLVPGKNYFAFEFGYGNQGRSASNLVFIYRGGEYGKDPNVEGKCGDEIIKTHCADGDTRSCTKMIYCNGWKIPDDYPIKF